MSGPGQRILRDNPSQSEVQDWGGPIGFWVATRHPERVRGFGVGKHLGLADQRGRAAEWFSKTSAVRVLGELVKRRRHLHQRPHGRRYQAQEAPEQLATQPVADARPPDSRRRRGCRVEAYRGGIDGLLTFPQRG